jgi:hypothetical protein
LSFLHQESLPIDESNNTIIELFSSVKMTNIVRVLLMQNLTRKDNNKSYLVSDAVKEEVSSLGLEVNGQVLEDVHVRRVRDGRHAGRQTLGADELNGGRAHVHHQRVDQLDIVPVNIHKY